MRTAMIELGGKKYPAAFSLAVMRDLEDRTGRPASEALDEMADRGSVTDTVWLLAQLLKAGAVVAGNGQTPPSEGELFDQLGIDDIHSLTAQVLGATRTIKPALESETKKPKAKLRRALQMLLG